jgi:hypothetical protein
MVERVSRLVRDRNGRDGQMTEYGMGTRLDTRGPWSQVVGGRAMCPDGKVRALARVSEADTAWTRPAAVRVRGRYVRGYVFVETAGGWQTPLDEDPKVLKFVGAADIREAIWPGLPTCWRVKSETY